LSYSAFADNISVIAANGSASNPARSAFVVAVMRSNADGIAADDPLDSADADDSVRAPSSLAARTTRRVRRVRTVVRINRGDDRAARDGAPMVAVIASTVVAIAREAVPTSGPRPRGVARARTR
jgi:hypothetical protein